MAYQKSFSTRKTDQKQPIPSRTDQIPNSEGGFVWAVDDWERLRRFITLGSEGGTFYIKERELTIENAEAVVRCIKEDGVRVVNNVVEISHNGRAYKNEPALFVLAMCAGMGDEETRKAALAGLPTVARIGTHLFNFLNYVQAFRGWGRGLRNAVAAWYTEKPLDKLVYQVLKYRQRNGWTHRDVLRKAHPQTGDETKNALFSWIVSGEEAGIGENERKIFDIPLIESYLIAQHPATENALDVAELIIDTGLTREMVPTQFLKSPEVWEALLEKMPLTAMIRNLGKMGNVGLLIPGNFDATQKVVNALGDEERLRKSRVHPIQILSALSVYGIGQGIRGSLTWSPVSQILDALDGAFYTSFQNVEPTNKRIMLALDISSSMTMRSLIAHLTSRDLSAAMALVTAAVEPDHMFMGFHDKLIPLSISSKQRLDDVVSYIDGLGFGGTDCSLPMQYALDNKIEIDAFVIYTDSETHFGSIHPAQALQNYRREINPTAKLVVVGMEANEFSIADPNDAGMLDVVGFGTMTPQVIANFTRD